MQFIWDIKVHKCTLLVTALFCRTKLGARAAAVLTKAVLGAELATRRSCLAVLAKDVGTGSSHVIAGSNRAVTGPSAVMAEISGLTRRLAVGAREAWQTLPIAGPGVGSQLLPAQLQSWPYVLGVQA